MSDILQRSRDQRPCPCRCAPRYLCPVPDNGAECPCNPYKRGRGHKGSDALLEAVKKRHERSGRPRIAPVETPRKLRPACVPEASDQ